MPGPPASGKLSPYRPTGVQMENVQAAPTAPNPSAHARRHGLLEQCAGHVPVPTAAACPCEEHALHAAVEAAKLGGAS